MTGLAVKRAFDIAVSALLLLMLAPLLALIALAIKVESWNEPLFFNDAVMGLHGSRFTMFKFRTMVSHAIDYESRPEVHAGNPLVTRVGGVLRRMKLDELPQLVNVLRGEMSVVGPRPMDPVRFSRASEFQRQRLMMRPGLTGWAQVSGNIQLTWDERMELDIWYVANWSLGLDARILAATAPVLIFGERKRSTPVPRVTDTSFRVSAPGRGSGHGRV